MAKVESMQPTEKAKISRISQSDFPMCSLERALVIAKGLWDEFAGGPAEPHQLAIAVKISPTSSTWRQLTGAAVGYGLTDGGYHANLISLAPIGRAIVAPTSDGQAEEAVVDSVLQPRLMRQFFERYNRAKLPSKQVGENMLVSMGLPKDRVEQCFEILTRNGRYAGLITDTTTGPFVAITTGVRKGSASEEQDSQPRGVSTSSSVGSELGTEEVEEFARKVTTVATKPQIDPKPSNNRVFVSHGKNRQVVEQLKEIIKFGKYEPVISVENETTSKPVPDKVLDDMRSCFAGIIDVHSEGELLDQSGNKHVKINDNVLIEIGAAMALYGRNYILLVQKGVQLPSNLQGLYRCEYDGDKLDWEATMKLLKTFNQFS